MDELQGRERDIRECERIEEFTQKWVQEGTVSPAGLVLLRTHCVECAHCSLRYAWLLAFLDWDARGHPVAEQKPRPSDKVMTKAGSAAGWSSVRPLALAAMIAACFILFAGAGFLVRGLFLMSPSEDVVVRFELDAPQAKTVTVVGSFNGWDTTALPMKDANRDGVWRITVHLKRGSINLYNFLVDGSQWIPDPKSTVQVDDGFGGKTSVLRL